MTAFMDSFPTSRAGKLAELEGIQMAGTARQNPFGRTSNPDVPPLVFDESQARAMWPLCSACIMKSWSRLLHEGIRDNVCMVGICHERSCVKQHAASSCMGS